MRQQRLMDQAPGSVSAVLADIAHELSSIQGWRDRVGDSLSLLCDLLPGSDVLLGAETDRWEFFWCSETAGEPEEAEKLLLQHYNILTGRETPLIVGRLTSIVGEPDAVREIEGTPGSFLSMPVVGADRVIGVLHVRSERPDAYAVDDVRLASVVASQIGSYLMNVLAYEREQKARIEIERLQVEAERNLHLLQQALLPAQPAVGEGYDIASVYLPGFEGQEIGGDFYDVFATEDGHVCIFIGDVSGKGIPAASMAAATRSTVRAFAYELQSAGEILTHSNTVLSRYQSEHGLFVTVFLIIMDPSTGRMRYCGAGHPPAAVYRKGNVELLTFGHPPLGTSDRFEFGEDETRLEPGDKLVLYTDGISEARRDREMFGLEGVVESVRRHGMKSSEDLVGELLSDASSWASGHLADDVAIVVLGRDA